MALSNAMASHLHRASVRRELSGGKRGAGRVPPARDELCVVHASRVRLDRSPLAHRGTALHAREQVARRDDRVRHAGLCQRCLRSMGPRLPVCPRLERPDLHPQSRPALRRDLRGGTRRRRLVGHGRPVEPLLGVVGRLFQLQPRLQGGRFPVRPLGDGSARAIAHAAHVRRGNGRFLRRRHQGRCARRRVAPEQHRLPHARSTTINSAGSPGSTAARRTCRSSSSRGVELETGYRPGALEFSFSGIYQEVQFGDSGFPARLDAGAGHDAAGRAALDPGRYGRL